MTLLFNWRLWLAIAFAAALAFGSYQCVQFGKNSVQVEFDVYKNQQILNTLAAEVAARAKEHVMQDTNLKVSENYEILKAATATAVKSLDADRMRLQSALAAASSRPTPGNTGAGLKPDASPESRILSSCLSRYEEVAGDADQLSDQVTGLQDYINRVVPK